MSRNAVLLLNLAVAAMALLATSCSSVSTRHSQEWKMVRQWQAAGFQGNEVTLEGLRVVPGTDKIVLPHDDTDPSTGAGVPMVLWRPASASGDANRLGLGTVTPVTALMVGAPDSPRVRLIETLDQDSWANVRLAVDRAAAYDVFLDHAKDSPMVGFQGGFNPGKRLRDQGLYMATPYSPDLIPVVFVHGMLAAPAGFYPMLEAIAQDPELTSRYQFWFYGYPTGMPLLDNATDFRLALEKACRECDPEGDDAALSRMVIVGHSMGGLMARMAVSYPGTSLYDGFFKVPLEQLHLTTEQKQAVREQLLYEPIPWPSRLVFMSTPHHGSDLAGGKFGHWASNIVKMPKVPGVFATAIRAQDPKVLTPMSQRFVEQVPSSFETFDMGDPIWGCINHLQFRRGVKFHTITGVRDSVVPAQSSAFPGAESELVVQDGHSVPTHKTGIAEVIRILHEHR